MPFLTPVPSALTPHTFHSYFILCGGGGVDGDDRREVAAVLQGPGTVEVGGGEDDRALAAHAAGCAVLSHGDAKPGGGGSRDEGRPTGGWRLVWLLLLLLSTLSCDLLAIMSIFCVLFCCSTRETSLVVAL